MSMTEEDSIETKSDQDRHKVYGGKGISAPPAAKSRTERIVALGLPRTTHPALQTQYSSHDAKNGSTKDFTAQPVTLRWLLELFHRSSNWYHDHAWPT